MKKSNVSTCDKGKMEKQPADLIGSGEGNERGIDQLLMWGRGRGRRDCHPRSEHQGAW